MTNSPSLVQILSRTDTELRKLIEESLAQGRYSEVAAAARIADSILRLLDLVTGKGRAGDPSAASEAHAQEEASPSESLNLQRRRPARDLPRFERDGDKLVKIAWSKRDRAEYEHRAPRRAVDILVDAIRKKKGEGTLFEAADVLPIKDPITRQEVPSYQSYLALAWLRDEGAITKQGRKGYVLKPGAARSEQIAALWEALPTKQ